MPSKIPQEAEIDSDDGEEMMMPMGGQGYPGIPERKEYLWSCNLKGEKDTYKFEGGDSECENIIFKSAALGSGASGKHTVEVSAVDANSEKVTAILCILNDERCWISLPELSIEPPLLLTLTEGKGPVNICANHILEEDPDEEDEDEEEGAEEDQEMAAVEPESDDRDAEEEVVSPAPKKKKPDDMKKRKADEDAKESPVKKAKPDKKDKKVKSYDTIDDVKKAILANPGGKPKKEEKFGNWVKNTMKCSNEEWIKQLWTWHKTENKL